MKAALAPDRPRHSRARLEIGPGLALSVTLEDGTEIARITDFLVRPRLRSPTKLAGRVALIDRGAAQVNLELAEILERKDG